jgi:hypothetical protein
MHVSLPVRAQEFDPPPPPSELPPTLAGEVHLGLVTPIRPGRLCPAHADCIFNGGGGIGGALEWRYSKGLGIGLGYDGFFLNGNGVYELTVIQILRATLGYRMLMNSLVHPFVGVGVGVAVIGDKFHFSSLGGSVDLSLGVELEVSHLLAARFGLGLWLQTYGPFTSVNDSVRRASSLDLAIAGTLQIGLVILEDR